MRVKNILDGRAYQLTVSDGIISELKEIPLEDGLPLVVPGGLVDTQVNGYLGHDYSDPAITTADMEKISLELARRGTLRHFATIVTRPEQTILSCIDAIVKACNESEVVKNGLAGIHIEGNYISRLDGPRGAHDLEYVRPASIEEFDRWYEHARGLLRYITVGAEAEGVIPLIEHAVSKGVVVALGHTGASAAQIDAAVQAGARVATHVGNGIFQLLDRFENPLWPQLRNSGLAAGVIVDGCHVTPDLVWIISRCKDPESIILVSDLIACAGLPKGRMKWGNMDVEIVADGSVRLAGTPYLAGAGSHLLNNVYNYSVFTGKPLSQAFRAATLNPIKMYGLDEKLTVLQKNRPADFVVSDGPVVVKAFLDGREIV